MTLNELQAWPGKTEEIVVNYSLYEQCTKPLNPGITTKNSGFNFEYDGVHIEHIEEYADESLDLDEALDYKLAATSGIISGSLDSFFTEALSVERANAWGEYRVNKLVIAIAKLDSTYTGDSLKSAIKFLEENHPFAGDQTTAEFGGGRQHHLRDFSHHFSISGLAFSILTQFSGRIFGTDQHGTFITIKVPDTTLIGNNIFEKLTLGTIEWLLHMASDMAGSSSNPGKGTGIPGPLLSLMKLVSSLPFFGDAMEQKTGFRRWISKLFNGTLLKTVNDNGETVLKRFNLRSEIGILHELSRQIIPVLINECFVRSCYFVHHLYSEIKTNNITSINQISTVKPEKILPVNNHRVARMATIATSTFTIIDLIDAAVRSVIKNGFHASPQALFISFASRINYANLLHMTFSIGVDIRTAWSLRNKKTAEEKKSTEESEKNISDYKLLLLSPEENNILYSLQLLSIRSDIKSTKSKQTKLQKQAWLDEWIGITADTHTIFDNDEIMERINCLIKQYGDTSWIHLIVLETALFTPYTPLSSDSSKGRRKLKFNNDYFDRAICVNRPELSNIECVRMRKAFYHNKGILDSTRSRRLIGAAGTAAVATITGGAAFVFAPVVAPIIAGSTVAGLSGAALTSASLATLGGGALAAGGLGAAGGTAIIAGGGTALGLAGGGMLAGITLKSDTNGKFVLYECAKLLTYCQEALISQNNGAKLVGQLRQRLVYQINRLDSEKAILSEISVSNSINNNKENRRIIKLIDISLKYMKRCSKELLKIIGNAETQPMKLLDNA